MRMEWTQIHAKLEALLFASGDALSLDQLASALEQDPKVIQTVLHEMMDEYRFLQRGIRLHRLENCYQLLSAPEYATSIRAILKDRKPERLSRSALEVLSIVAYYQPVTKTYVEQVRGVDSAYSIGLLLDRDLVEPCGRLDVPGRPILYRTTQSFLRLFGLASLDELPELPAVHESEEEKGSV